MLNNGQYAPLSIRSYPGRHRPPRSYLTSVLSSYSPLHGPVPGITLLSSNQLSGQIPAELGSLDSLKELTLDSNQLSGEIPRELGNLSNLTNLVIDNNPLTGKVPSELSNLRQLGSAVLLGDTELECIPSSLVSMAEQQGGGFFGVPEC